MSRGGAGLDQNVRRNVGQLHRSEEGAAWLAAWAVIIVASIVDYAMLRRNGSPWRIVVRAGRKRLRTQIRPLADIRWAF